MYSILTQLLGGAVATAMAVPAPVADGGPLITTHHSQTPLRDFKGCSDKDREAILDSFQEASTILSTPSILKVNFTSTAALDFFGPASRNQDW